MGVVKKIVLTGGPCAGKTTLQSLLSDVFENLGWKVFRVPETATVLLNGGVYFKDLTEEQAYQFQKDLLAVMLKIEQTFFNLAETEAEKGHSCVVVCDRGAMDPSAYMERKEWLRLIRELGLNEIELRDERYDYVVHMVSAADGASPFYGNGNNQIRSEEVKFAVELDKKTQQAWLGFSYFDVVDNSTGFEQKCHRVIATLLNRLGLEDKRYGKNIRKLKFLVDSSFDFDAQFPVQFQQFTVEHIFLLSQDQNDQIRIRKRTQNSLSHFNWTLKRISEQDASNFVEFRRSLTVRDYEALLLQADPDHVPIKKERKCFLYKNAYFQLDLFLKPQKMAQQMILEAYLTKGVNLKTVLPDFIPIIKEITGQPEYSMFDISLSSNQQQQQQK